MRLKSIFFILFGFIIVHGQSQKMPARDVLVSDSLSQISDTEFDPYGKRMCWQTTNDNSLWICHLDTITWGLVIPDGKEIQIDTGLTPLSSTSNAAEWGYDINGTYLVYNKSILKKKYIAIAAESSYGTWSNFTMLDAAHRINPHASQNPNDSVMAFHYISSIIDWKTKYKFIDHPDWERAVWGFIDAHWTQGEQMLTGIFSFTNQVGLFDPPERKCPMQLTFDYEDVYTKPFMWHAPEHNNARMFFAIANGNEMRVFKETNLKSDSFALYMSFPTPSSNPLFTRFASPEPVVYNGQSYALFMASSSQYETDCVPAEIWIAKLDSVNPVFTIVSDSSKSIRTDPESFPTNDQLLVYYTEVVDSIAPYVVYRVHKCETGILGPGIPTGEKEKSNIPVPDLTVFPNPFHDRLYLRHSTGDERYRLTDQLGRTVWKGTDLSLQDFHALKQGFYFLQVQSGRTCRSIPVSKQ